MTVIEPAPTSVDSTVNQSTIWHIWEFTYGVFVKMLIAAPVFVSQSQIDCLRKFWHKEDRVHSMEISNGYKHTCAHAYTHRRTQMGCRVAAVCVKKRKLKRLVCISVAGASCLTWSGVDQYWQQLQGNGWEGGLRGDWRGGGHSGNPSKWQTVQSVHGSPVSAQHES